MVEKVVDRGAEVSARDGEALRPDLLVVAQHGLLEQARLGAEVAQQGLLGDAGVRGDGPDCRLVPAVGEEALDGGVEKRLTRPLLGLCARHLGVLTAHRP